MNKFHKPILCDLITNLIKNNKNITNILDCTFGSGGHSKNILKNTMTTTITAVDVDENVIKFTQEIINQYPKRFTFFLNNFKNINLTNINCVICDLGLSSMAIDQPNRGFSYKKNGPLNMMMDNTDNICKDFLNNSSIKILANTILKYGEEKNYYNIAKNIFNNKPINTTEDLRNIIDISLPKHYDNIKKIKSYARVFQAIRIHINDEINNLNILLNNIYLQKKITSFFICFHSIELNTIKNFLIDKKIKWTIYLPSELEKENNSRSRSAKLIVFKL